MKEKTNYRDNPTYKALETILNNAGIKIDYTNAFEDVYGRCRAQDLYIQMPENPEYYAEEAEEFATLVLGHEAGHILTAPYVADPQKRTAFNGREYVTEDKATMVNNEALCDLIGVYLYRLAELTADQEIEKQWRGGEVWK